MTQDLVSSLAEELSYRYNRMKEDAIYRNLMRCEGEIPNPDTLAAHGRFVRVRQGMDDYEEFQFRGKPLFQIRLRFDVFKAFVDVKDL